MAMKNIRAKSTMVELVTELQEIQPRTPAIAFMIAEAMAGEYHDFKNQKYACGKVEVVTKLRAEGLIALANRVIDGEFDESMDADDINEMRRTTPKELWGVLGL